METNKKRPYNMSPETREKLRKLMSKNIKAFWANMTKAERDEHIKKIRRRKFTEEERAEYSERMKEAWRLLKETDENKKVK